MYQSFEMWTRKHGQQNRKISEIFLTDRDLTISGNLVIPITFRIRIVSPVIMSLIMVTLVLSRWRILASLTHVDLYAEFISSVS